MKHLENPDTRACRYCQASYNINTLKVIEEKAGFFKGTPSYPLGECEDCLPLVPDPAKYGLDVY